MAIALGFALWGSLLILYVVLIAMMVWLLWKAVRIRRWSRKALKQTAPPEKSPVLKVVQLVLLAAALVCAWMAPRQPDPVRSPYFWGVLVLFAAIVVTVVIQRNRRPGAQKPSAWMWLLYGVLAADLISIILYLFLPQGRMVLSWVMVAISAAGLVLSILFCHRCPLQKDSPFWQIFPQKKSSKRQFVWDLVFCLSLVLAVVCLVLFFASALGGVTWLGYGAAAGMIVFWLIPIYLLFPALLSWIWKRVCWRQHTGSGKMPKRSGLERAGFWLAFAAVVLHLLMFLAVLLFLVFHREISAIAYAMSLDELPDTVKSLMLLYLALTVPRWELVAMGAAVSLFALFSGLSAVTGVVVSIIGLARKEKPQLPPAAPGTPAASAPVQAPFAPYSTYPTAPAPVQDPSAPNPVQDPADASSVKQPSDDSM